MMAVNRQNIGLWLDRGYIEIPSRQGHDAISSLSDLDKEGDETPVLPGPQNPPKFTKLRKIS